MGRPPSNGAPSFRFHPSEVAQMEAILQKHEGHVPPRDFLVALAQRFSQSPERAGKIVVQMKQIWNWFQNKRYALRAKSVKSIGKSTTLPVTRDEVTPVRNTPLFPQSMTLSSGPLIVRNTSEASFMEFEAKSSRDGAWYDVQEFLSHRYIETGNPEVLVRFSGFGPDEDEWRNIRKHVRQRSLPCEAPECIAVLSGDLILCFQEGKEQALYFDAHVLDAQRRRHDVRGCRCRFLVRFDHDQSEEIVPLRKICRRPETDYRLQQHHAAIAAAETNKSFFGITGPNPSTAPLTLLLEAAASTSVKVEPPVHVIDQTINDILGITSPNPSTPPVTLIPAASSSVEPPAHVVDQTDVSIFGTTGPSFSTPPVTPSPAVHVVDQTNDGIFGITGLNPSTVPVALISPSSVEPPVQVVSQTDDGIFGKTGLSPSTAPVALISPSSVEPPVQVVSQTDDGIFGKTGLNPSTVPVALIPSSISVETPAHVASQTNNTTNPNPSTAPVTLIPAASTSTSVSVEPRAHVVDQSNNSSFGMSNRNPSTSPVTLTPQATTFVSVDSPVHMVGQLNNNSIFRRTSHNPSTATNFPSPVLRIGRSARRPSAPSTSPILPPAQTVPQGFTSLLTSVVNQSSISTSVQAQAVTVPNPPGFTPLLSSFVTQSPNSTSVQAPAVTVPNPPGFTPLLTSIVTQITQSPNSTSVQAPAVTLSVPPGFTWLSTPVVTESPISTPVQALVGNVPVSPGMVRVSTAVTVPVFPASLTASTQISASFPEQNKVRSDVIKTYNRASVSKPIKVEYDDSAPIPEPNKVERVNPVASNDEASAHANLTSPVELSTVIEAKNVPDGHPNGKPSIFVSGQEKVESSSTTEKLKE